MDGEVTVSGGGRSRMHTVGGVSEFEAEEEEGESEEEKIDEAKKTKRKAKAEVRQKIKAVAGMKPTAAHKNGSNVLLLACVVFPRAVDEQANTRETFASALNAATNQAAGGRTVRVVTHALGVFTGHHDPPLFAKSMAQGLAAFLNSEAMPFQTPHGK
jgi:hypothetical protein